MRDAVRFAAAAVLGAMATAAAPSPFVEDLPPVSPGSAMSVKKDVEAEGRDDDGEAVLASLANVHTGEVVPLDDASPSAERWSTFLEDRVTGTRVELDPRLLGLLRRIARAHAGARVEIVSGYRSPKLNEMLRKKEHRVASHSQHSLGHAVDFRVEGVTPLELRKEIEDLGWKGGIGQYDAPTDRFVHADVGRDRRWHER